MSEDTIQVEGGCYCGRVRYRAAGVSPSVTECHCTQCRKQSGHRYASVGGKTSDLRIEGAVNLTWFSASPDAERGFCSTCGCHLFAEHEHNPGAIWYMPATLEGEATPGHPEGSEKRIFVGSKSPLEIITDDLPQFIDYNTPANKD